MREDFHECPGPEGAAFLACQVGARPAIRTGDKGPALRPRMPPCLAYRGSDLAAVRSPTGRSLLKRPPRGRDLRDRAEQLPLVGHHPEIADHPGLVRDRAR